MVGKKLLIICDKPHAKRVAKIACSTISFLILPSITHKIASPANITQIKKLAKNSQEIELLSDGSPKKSSLYVKDGVSAIFTILEKANAQVNIFNIGHTEVLTIDKIVDIILDELKVKPKKKYLGGERGWKGDNNFVLLSAEKLKKLGWEPKYSIVDGIRKTVRYLQENPQLFVE